MTNRISPALATVANALSRTDRNSIETACHMIASANSVGLYGCGREGFQMRGFAMRLFHLGFDVGYVGETTMPALGPQDVFIVSSGPGRLSTVEALMQTARSAGAAVILITAQSDLPEAKAGDLVIKVQAQTMANDADTDEQAILPMGSVYEGALFFLCEWIVADLKSISGETANKIRSRHTNME